MTLSERYHLLLNDFASAIEGLAIALKEDYFEAISNKLPDHLNSFKKLYERIQ